MTKQWIIAKWYQFKNRLDYCMVRLAIAIVRKHGVVFDYDTFSEFRWTKQYERFNPSRWGK